MIANGLGLPFTAAQLAALFGDYKAIVWSVLLVAYGLGFLTIFLLLVPGRTTSRAIAIILAALWVWTGIVYHALYFSTLNDAALLAGAAFLVEGLIVLRAGWRGELRFGDQRSMRAAAGIALVCYAIAVYPLLGLAFSSAHRGLSMLGVTPTPVTMFTVGCLLLATRPVPRSILMIPMLWSLIGGIEALLLYVPQDWPLLASAVAAFALLKESRRGDELAVQERRA
jgi:Family of unknown function (DUF6064)